MNHNSASVSARLAELHLAEAVLANPRSPKSIKEEALGVIDRIRRELQLHARAAYNGGKAVAA